jgi:hypothetical protein
VDLRGARFRTVEVDGLFSRGMRALLGVWMSE